MYYDREAASSKRSELVALIAGRLAGSGEHPSQAVRLAESIVDSACRITAPEEPPRLMEMITLSEGGRRGGTSAKPGNVTLNVGKLITSAAAGALTLAGGTGAAPWTVPLMALVLWDSLWSHLKVDIQEREATVLWALWINQDDTKCVSKASLLSYVNSERATHGRASLSAQELSDATQQLQRMGCIKDAKNPNNWRLCEWVRVKFR